MKRTHGLLFLLMLSQLVFAGPRGPLQEGTRGGGNPTEGKFIADARLIQRSLAIVPEAATKTLGVTPAALSEMIDRTQVQCATDEELERMQNEARRTTAEFNASEEMIRIDCGYWAEGVGAQSEILSPYLQAMGKAVPLGLLQDRLDALFELLSRG